MAVFASTAAIDNKPLTELIGTDALSEESERNTEKSNTSGKAS
jgi:hypothetical protein